MTKTVTSKGSTITVDGKETTGYRVGDTNMMVYWILLGMAALAGCTAVVYRKKKKNQ